MRAVRGEGAAIAIWVWESGGWRGGFGLRVPHLARNAIRGSGSGGQGVLLFILARVSIVRRAPRGTRVETKSLGSRQGWIQESRRGGGESTEVLDDCRERRKRRGLRKHRSRRFFNARFVSQVSTSQACCPTHVRPCALSQSRRLQRNPVRRAPRLQNLPLLRPKYLAHHQPPQATQPIEFPRCPHAQLDNILAAPERRRDFERPHRRRERVLPHPGRFRQQVG